MFLSCYYLNVVTELLQMVYVAQLRAILWCYWTARVTNFEKCQRATLGFYKSLPVLQSYGCKDRCGPLRIRLQGAGLPKCGYMAQPQETYSWCARHQQQSVWQSVCQLHKWMCMRTGGRCNLVTTARDGVYSEELGRDCGVFLQQANKNLWRPPPSRK